MAIKFNGNNKKEQKYTVFASRLEGGYVVYQTTTVTGVTMYLGEKEEDLEAYGVISEFADGSVMLRNAKSSKTYQAQGILCFISDDDDDDDDEEEEEVNDAKKTTKIRFLRLAAMLLLFFKRIPSHTKIQLFLSSMDTARMMLKLRRR
jgi:hypothetical protein